MTRTSRRFRHQLAALAAAAASAMVIAAITTYPVQDPPRPLQEAPPPAYEGRANSNLPPERFQMRQGATVAMVVFTTPDAVAKICARLGTPVLEGYVTRGCTARIEAGPVMVLPNPCLAPGPYMSPSYVACHEIGHANAWPGTHGE